MPTFKRADQEQLEKAQDLLEASTQELGFAKSLFFGRLKLDDVLPYPKQDPDEASRTDELIAKVDAFMKANVDADRIDLEERIPQSVIDGLGHLGVLGMVVPKEYGGGGFSHTAYCRVLEHVSRHCASTAVMVGAHQSIGLKALVLMGTEAQKREFLPELATRKLSAFCLSEPEVGSDAANVQTTARLSDDGSHWILNGDKKFATNAALAGMMTVMAKTTVTDNGNGKTKEKVTAFIVTPDLPGFEIVSPNRSKCGIRGTWQGTLRFTDMRVPRDRVLGEVGKGLKVALSVLDYGRCTLSAGCVGGAKRALELAVERARTRKQFGRPIAEFHLIKEKIARMAETTFAMESVTYLAAGAVDRHRGDIMLETAIAKLFCSEGLWQVVDDTLQIWGGEGYMREHGIERMLRDARINRIVEGATEVMTAFVALVGMKGVGEQFEQVLRAGKHPIGNFGRLAEFAHSQWSDIVVGPHFTGLRPELAAEGQALAGLTKQLARSVGRLLRRYRHDILDLELLHQRVAWSVVDLYAMAAVISRLEEMLAHTADNGNGHATMLNRDLLLGKSFCHNAADRITHRLQTLFNNRDAEILYVADSMLAAPAAQK
jgi:alkylation response protein AidB-like acyl-CoA dehydrogenase